MATNNSVNFNQSSNLNTVYVSKNGGSDTFGNGTILYPYATLYHAISTITTAASNNQFKVILQCGSYFETTNLVLKPWIYIDGNNSDLTTTGTITADTSWNSGGNGIFENFNNFICLSGLTFDFSGAGFQGVTFFFNNITSLFLNPVTFTGSGSSTRINFIDCNLNTSPTFNNCNFKLQNYTGFNVTTNYTTSSPTQFFTSYMDNVALNSTTTITSDGVHFAQVYITNSPLLSGFPGNVSASGANLTLLMSSDSVTDNNIPVLSGGATVTYLGLQNSLSNNVYVSQNGSNTTGTGHILNPFATVAHAMTTITTASPSNPINIVISGYITETVQTLLKPNVSISSLNADSILDIETNSVDMILDSTYISSTTQSIAFFNDISIYGNLNFDMSTRVVSGYRQFTFGNVQIDSNFSINGCASSLTSVQLQNGTSAGLTKLNNIDIVYMIGCPLSTLTCGDLTSVKSTNVYLVNCSTFNVSLEAQIGGFSNTYYVSNSLIRGTFTLTNPLCTLNIDTASYITPTIVNSATVNLTNIIGITDGSNAAAGHVGEYTEVSIPVGSPVSLTSGLEVNVGTISSLDSGDWEVRGIVVFKPNAATTTSSVEAAINTSSHTLPSLGSGNNYAVCTLPFAAGQYCSFTLGPQRISLSSPSNVYLIAKATFAVNVMDAYGFISARRIR